MASFVYALSAEGHGHTSRAVTVGRALRRRGHEVVFCCGGAARARLEAQGEKVIAVPGLSPVIRDNRGRFGATVRSNTLPFLLGFALEPLIEAFAPHRPDLLISDFEPFSAVAAECLGLPILSLNRQQIVTETRYRLPLKFRAAAMLTAAAVDFIVPARALHTIVPSFCFPPLKRPGGVTLIPPVVRDAVRQGQPERGDDVLVYINHDSSAALLDTLRRAGETFIVYSTRPPADPARYPNLTFRPFSQRVFTRDLLRCRGVIATAGFNLISEALYLGKPILVHPNRGFFEQTLNALFLEQIGLGRASFGRTLGQGELGDFVRCLPRASGVSMHAPKVALGNDRAVAVIEALLRRLLPRSVSHPGFDRAFDRASEDRPAA